MYLFTLAGLALIETYLLVKLKPILKVWFKLKTSKNASLGIRINQNRTIDLDVLIPDNKTNTDQLISLNYQNTLLSKDAKDTGLALFLDRTPTYIYIEGNLDPLHIFDKDIQKAGWDAAKVKQLAELSYNAGRVKGLDDMEKRYENIQKGLLLIGIGIVLTILIMFYNYNQMQSLVQTMTQQILQRVPQVLNK